jgi:predicted nucleic acid-binding Zn ribbon protein
MPRAASNRTPPAKTPPASPPAGAARFGETRAEAKALAAARQQALAEWRRFDYAPLEVARAVAAKPVGEILSRLTASLRLDQRRAEIEILKVWNHLLDPALVAHAQPAGLRHGTLFVNVDSSVWLSEIVRYRRHEILERLQHSFGRDLIRRISFRLG